MLDLGDTDAILREYDVLRLTNATSSGLSGVASRAHTEYQRDPIGWIVDKLGIPENTLRWSLNPGYADHGWDGTPDPLAAVMEALVRGEDTGVESATGTGKSFLAGCLVLWFLACFEDSRVYTYAPYEKQLRLYMWSEIGKLWPRFQRHFPSAVLTDLRIRMNGTGDRWSAHGYAVKLRAGEESATGVQGAHAEHMLLITEETPGIDPSVMVAIQNTKSADHNIQLSLGNPDSQHDPLHTFCNAKGTTSVRISALDHPNVVCGRTIVPGATGAKSVAERLAAYGEDGRLYRSRVRGISPAEAADSIIKHAWLVSAAGRFALPDFRDGPRALGVDVAASEDGDKAAIARWVGACLMQVQSFQCPDPTELGLNVGAEMKADGVDPRRVGVDSVAVGAATVGRLKEMGYMVRALNAGSKPWGQEDLEWRAKTGESVYDVEEFGNLRSQMWWTLRLDLQDGKVAVCDDPELFEDLTTPTWFTRGGKIFVEPKEEIVKRLGRSPDKGDAAVLGNFVRERPKFVKPQEPPRPRNQDQGLEKVLKRMNDRKTKGRPFG